MIEEERPSKLCTGKAGGGMVHREVMDKGRVIKRSDIVNQMLNSVA